MLRWGILGTAQIARKNWKAILNSGNGVVVAVASRNGERSRQFVEECQLQAPFEVPPRPLATYQQLIAAPDVDAVYVPLPTGIRKEWVQRAAEAGKHVVCEKPCALTVADLKEMMETCNRNRVQFMDGVMFMHSARLPRMRAVLQDRVALGQLKRITSTFAFEVPDAFFASNVRVQSDLEPHGCLGDLGWYCIRFALWVMDWQLPLRVSGKMLSEFKHSHSKAPVPTEFSGELFFEGGVSSSFYCSFLTGIEQWVIVTGTHGHLHIRDFVLPFSGNELGFEVNKPNYQMRGSDFEMLPHTSALGVKEHSHSHPSAQESNLFRNFADKVLSDKLDESWPDIALKTQIVMQACRESSVAQGRLVDIGTARLK